MGEAEVAVENSHPVDQHFGSLVDYLRHLVDEHAVDETPSLWASGRTRFDDLHARAHKRGVFGNGTSKMPARRQRSKKRRGRCPYCHREYVILRDGRFYWHAIRPGEPCRGALEPAGRDDSGEGVSG